MVTALLSVPVVYRVIVPWASRSSQRIVWRVFCVGGVNHCALLRESADAARFHPRIWEEGVAMIGVGVPFVCCR